MADQQILAAGSEDAPFGYTVPNTVTLNPKAVSGVFDGTGASGDFVPLLEIVSDGGVVVAQSPGSTVTAGGSVEQSWFPRVAPSAASVTGSGADWAHMSVSSLSFATTGLGTANVSLTSASFVTSNTSVYAAGTSGGVNGIQVNASGFYLVTTTADGDVGSAPAANAIIQVLCGQTQNVNVVYLTASPWFEVSATDFEAYAVVSMILEIGTISNPVGTVLRVLAGQNTGGTVTLDAALTVQTLASA